jgi:NAD(P)H dehydrogenase (quinone)
MYAILGATGKVGRATIRSLRAQGHAVRAIVRDASKAAELASAGCELAVADLGDPAALTAAFRGVTAAQVICPVLARASDALGEMSAVSDTLAEALAAARVPAVVAISDYGAEVAEGTGVTLIFRQLEQRFQKLDAAVTFLRSAEHMQNWARLLRFAAETGVLPSMHHPLDKRFPTVSAGDVGVVSAELLTTPPVAGAPQIVSVEGPRRYTPIEVAAALTALVGREVVAQLAPRADWLSTLKAGGLGESYARLVVELYDAHNAGRIDVEAGAGEVRHGTTELGDALALLRRPPQPRSESR